MTSIDPAILKTKQHFDILDGMRGIAAIAVVTFHFMEMAYTDYSKNFIGHGFLAVDFFFCLSGFVIGYAYDSRIAQLGVWQFFKARLIRLHPLVILGSVLGLLTFLFDPFSGASALYNTGKIVLLFITSAFLIPYPAMADRSFNLFGLNAPSWSLFWEYVVNIVYALFLCKLNRYWLMILMVPAAVALCVICYTSGDLMGGWGKANFWHGAARISYSFLAGLLIYRSHWIIKNKFGFLGMAILLALAFVMPYGKFNWLSETLVILFYFPLLVSLGAGATLSAGLRKICVFSGRISYPLYMTHYSIIWIFLHYYTKFLPGTAKLSGIIIAGLILLIAFAYLVMVLYDTPLRRYLNNKRIKAAV